MKIYKIIFILLILVSVKVSYSQSDDDKMRIREKIDSVMKQKLIENSDFDIATADRFIETYRENNREIKMIMKEKRNLMDTIANNPGSADMDVKIDKLMELETSILDKRKGFFTELKTFLTPQQIAKTLVIRKSFEKEIRKEISIHRKDKKLKEKPDDEK